MIIQINPRCRIWSDQYQWAAQRQEVAEAWRSVAYYRTLDSALDHLKNDAKLCVEAELVMGRAIAAQLEFAKRRIDQLIGGRRPSEIPIPPAVAAFGSFMTAAGGIHYGLLKQIWAAESPVEIPSLIAGAIAFAEHCYREAAASEPRQPGVDAAP